jgi:hypothetical protein
MKTLLLFFSLFFVLATNAQNYDLIMGGSIGDAEKYSEAYLAPLERGIGHGGAVGIINFTNAKRKISVNLSMELSAAITPKGQRSFDINTLGFEEFQASDPNQSIAQSISGTDKTIGIETKSTYYKPSLSYPFYQEVPVAEFISPKGTGLSFMPLPTLTLGVYGFGTHLNFRFLPTIHPSAEMDFSTYGFSLQHNLDEFILKIKEWPVQIAIAGGYQYTHMEDHLDIQPDETKFGLQLGSDNGPYNNQKGEVTIVSIPLQVVVYHDFNGFTLFGGLGYTMTHSEMALKGNFPVYVKDITDNFKLSVDDISDPYAYSRSYNGFRFDLGLNYQIGFAKIKASYTYSKYQSFHFGVGVAI